MRGRRVEGVVPEVGLGDRGKKGCGRSRTGAVCHNWDMPWSSYDSHKSRPKEDPVSSCCLRYVRHDASLRRFFLDNPRSSVYAHSPENNLLDLPVRVV